MNMHHVTKSLFVGAAIVGTGMSSGRAEITFDEGFRTDVKNIVRGVIADRCEALNALHPNTISNVQLEEDTDRICNALFDRDTGFARYFTDAFYNAHRTRSDLWRLYVHPEKTLGCWLGRNVFRTPCDTSCLPDDVRFQGDTTLHIGTAVASLIERIKQRQMSETEITALRQTRFIIEYYCNRKNGYRANWYTVCNSISHEVATLWYPYVLARFDENKKAQCEVAQMRAVYRASSNLSRAFLKSLLNNYSRYLTIKEALQNNRFSRDIYQMYIRFKEAHKDLRRMALIEKYSSKTGKSGDGLVGYLGISDYTDRCGYCNEEEHWECMVKKMAEIEQLYKLVEGHPEVRRLSHRYRSLVRIWADSDNR